MSAFWSGYNLHNFLFKGLNSESVPGLLGICVGLFSVALLYEGLRSLKSIFLQKYSGNATIAGDNSHGTRQCNNGREEVLPPRAISETESSRGLICNNRMLDKMCNLFMASSFHSVYVFLGFTLMNAVMTFNVYIFLAAIFGIGLGYFFFYDCSRMKVPFKILRSDLAQCQSLLSPEVQEENMCSTDNNGLNGNNGSSCASAGVRPPNKSNLIVKAEINNVPSSQNSL